MSLSLADFWTVLDLTASNAAQFFTLTNEAIIIEDPVPVSLFGLALGFVILEFILYQINRLRPAGVSGEFSTGKSVNQERGK